MTATILVVDDEPDLEALVLQKFRKQIRDGAVTLWGRYLPKLTPVANGGFFLRNAVRGPRPVSTGGGPDSF
jgi:hypothetical protein